MFFPPFLLETPFLESFTRLISDILPLCCYTRPSIIIPLIKWIRFFFRYVELSPTVIFEQCKFSSSIFCFFWRDYREELHLVTTKNEKRQSFLERTKSFMKIFSADAKRNCLARFVSRKFDSFSKFLRTEKLKRFLPLFFYIFHRQPIARTFATTNAHIYTYTYSLI